MGFPVYDPLWPAWNVIESGWVKKCCFVPSPLPFTLPVDSGEPKALLDHCPKVPN